jgi:hypothetical protein
MRGISYSVKWNDVVIAIWTRYYEHTEAIERLKNVIVEAVPEELRPRNGFGPNEMFYKRHRDHKGFKKDTEQTKAGAST